MQRQPQRLLSLLLALVMILTCAPAALAEESTEAAMMRLMKTEGTVSVTNNKGHSVDARNQMRLNSGYSLKTQEASYAWINLDDVKLAKEDAISDISIRKSGKKLDILLNSGNLFFNVSEPLEKDETFSIRTSTMGIGIRGTCGWVKVIDQWTSQLFVLEGTVEVTVTDPVTGETKTETVKGGETVICKVYPQDTDGSRCGIIRQSFTVDDIEGFVLKELVVDRALCGMIYEDSGLDIPYRKTIADERLEEDQEELHDKQEKINDQQQEENKTPTWDDPEPDGVLPSTPCGLRTATFGCSVVSYAASTGYTDVPAGASYAEAVQYCKDRGLMAGTSDTTFSPDGTLTRAMMVTILHRLAGEPFASATAGFADVEQGKWYTEAISWASGRGIVNGYNAATFGANDPVTHEQVGLILQRYSGDPSVQVTGGESPKAPATRAEIAMTLMNYAKGRPGVLSDASAIDVMCAPSGIALDQDGNLMVTDVYGKQIWKVQNRKGTAYAGGATAQDLYGQPMGGYNDASLDSSYFKEPWAIAPFLDGWAVSDTANNVVRLVTSSSVQTLNGASNEKLKTTRLGVAFNGPTGLAYDDDGNLYVSDTLNRAVRRINPQGGVMTVAKNLTDPTGLCWKDGVLYIAETGRNRIVKLEKGKVTTVAGSGEEALTDGSAMEAAFSAPKGVAVGDDGSVYVADTGNGAIRVVKGGTVTTLAVRDPEQLGGGLMNPVGILVRGNSLYICDTFARRIFVYQQ